MQRNAVRCAGTARKENRQCARMVQKEQRFCFQHIVSCATIAAHTQLMANRGTVRGASGRVFDMKEGFVKVNFKSQPCEDIDKTCASSIVPVHDKIKRSPIGHYFPDLVGCAACEGDFALQWQGEESMVGVPDIGASDNPRNTITEGDEKRQPIDSARKPTGLFLELDGNDEEDISLIADESADDIHCRMVQIQSKAAPHLRLDKLLDALEIPYMPNVPPESLASKCVDFAKRRWGGSDDPKERKNGLENKIAMGILFEVLCVATYMNNVLEVSHGDLLTNHAGNILVHTEADPTAISIVDFDRLSERIKIDRPPKRGQVPKTDDDTLCNITRMNPHMSAAKFAATSFVAAFRQVDNPTKRAWSEAMNAALVARQH